ncbi:MAG: hypothetical protein JSU97_01580 [Dehalococcoidia bacterium]|nr:MAG: hypothetical protein JSU97_01580 [Dehalococcoidia bacterium]
MRNQYWLFFALTGTAVVAAACLIAILTGPPASAQPIAGATYTGTVSGGGTVDFTVSGDGSQVQGFTAYDIPGDTCEFQGANPFPIPLDIVGDSFGPGIPGLYEVSGSFPGESNAQGTLRLVLDEPPCDSSTLNWTAATSAPPPPSPSPSPTPSPTETATPTPSPTETATPTTTLTPTATSTTTPTPMSTATPTPTPTATPSSTDLVAGWNHTCYVGASGDIEDALDGISQDVLAAYRLGAGGYDKWFPNQPDVSTIATLSAYEPLFLLSASSAAWPQQPSGSPPAVTPLAQGWNSVCYAGEPKDVESATQGIGGQFAVLYALAPGQGWQRFVPGRPDLSDAIQLSRFASVLILVTDPAGTQWTFDP